MGHASRSRQSEDRGGLFRMDTDTTLEWGTTTTRRRRIRCGTERGLSISLNLNDITMLAAADELGAATKVATAC
jgi:urease accessory protein UreE